MSENYDNWERLVRVVLRRDEDRILALSHSRDSSIDSTSTSSDSIFDFDESIVPPLHDRSIPANHSDLVLDHSQWWEMLPPGKQEIHYTSATMRFLLDRRGRNCFVLGHMSLSFSDQNWEVDTHPKSRFSGVFVPKRSPSFEVIGSVNTQALTPKTVYAAYLVFGFSTDQTIHPPSPNKKSSYSRLYANRQNFKARNIHLQRGKNRGDGWKEIELGEFYIHEGIQVVLDALLVFFAGMSKKGLIIEGIEFRPSKNQRREGLELERFDNVVSRQSHLVNEESLDDTPESQCVEEESLDDDTPKSLRFKEGR